MDYFSLCLDGLCLAGQAFMHMIFVSHLTRKKPKIWYFAAYIFLLCGIEFLSAKFDVAGILPVCMEIIVLLLLRVKIGKCGMAEEIRDRGRAIL